VVGSILIWVCGHESSFLLFFFFQCCIMERSKHGVWDFVFRMELGAGAVVFFWVCGQSIFGRIFFGVVVSLEVDGSDS
jgi:hypothetical protein